MDDLMAKCLQAANECAREPWRVAKSGYPSRDEFDDAIAKLADDAWLDGEPYYRAYARALDSDDGRLLYLGRERARVPDSVTKKPERVELTRAERDIESATRRYMQDHRGVVYEKALTAVLDAEPELYRRCLEEK
jgi:hypothetical protein